MTADTQLIVRHLGLRDYESVWRAMSALTDSRDETTSDELWIVEHPPVFTQGQAGKAEHLLMPGDIPVIQVDRGGQVTYHGPGQLVAYPLVDIRRRTKGVRDLVTQIEQTLVATLADFAIDAYPKADAPGVYVRTGETEAKIASLGLRVRRGCSFHGLALNVDMDLSPFLRINPCGYAGLAMTQMADQLTQGPALSAVADRLIDHLVGKLGYTDLTLVGPPAALQTRGAAPAER